MRTLLLALGLAALVAAFFLPLVGIGEEDALPLEQRRITATDPDDRAFEELASRAASGEVLKPASWAALLDGIAERAYELEPDGKPERLERFALFVAGTGYVWPWLAGALLVLVLVTKSAPWWVRTLAMAVGLLYGGLALVPLVLDQLDPGSLSATTGLGLWLTAAGCVLVFLVAPFGKRPVLTFFLGLLLPLVVLGGIGVWIANA